MEKEDCGRGSCYTESRSESSHNCTIKFFDYNINYYSVTITIQNTNDYKYDHFRINIALLMGQILCAVICARVSIISSIIVHFAEISFS